MLKIGLFTFGGGYAMLALFEHEFVEKKHYMDKDEFLDMVALAESTPGPIAINSATYIGYKQMKFLGALIATIGICIPSFIIIFVISLFFDEFMSLTLVQYAFQGIQVCVVYLILSSGIRMLKQSKKNVFTILIIVAVCICMIIFSILSIRFSSIFYILICGTIGVCLYLLKRIRNRKEEEE